ncbi:uncharacterized protein N7529_006148 [Penicillium soppii]|uniref:uncharacterized protein n=1 Tax=Penicillium soppii TaxID=69789 RepID=UPI00254752CA|nr:uncharacterized protein N7529_006148 [Penicillium soppii]KAJ5864232.1 hypothetical protein N7529_006148 [Penicillium soppii]
MPRFLTDPRLAPTTPQPLLVIGAGLPRTATSSLQAALEQLGYNPCLHMAQIIPHADRQQLLINASREKNTAKRQKQLHELVDGYAAVCDMPAIFFLSDLLDMYPDAKVVLSVRPDAEIWARSCVDSLGFFFTGRFYWVGLLWKTDRLWYRLNMRILEWSQERFGEGNIFDPAFAERYNEAVRGVVEGRGGVVLEFKAEDGWGPLCGFLGREVPEAQFPRVNERRTFAVIRAVLVAKGLIGWVLLGAFVWFGCSYMVGLFV